MYLLRKAAVLGSQAGEGWKCCQHLSIQRPMSSNARSQTAQKRTRSTRCTVDFSEEGSDKSDWDESGCNSRHNGKGVAPKVTRAGVKRGRPLKDKKDGSATSVSPALLRSSLTQGKSKGAPAEKGIAARLPYSFADIILSSRHLNRAKIRHKIVPSHNPPKPSKPQEGKVGNKMHGIMLEIQRLASSEQEQWERGLLVRYPNHCIMCGCVIGPMMQDRPRQLSYLKWFVEKFCVPSPFVYKLITGMNLNSKEMTGSVTTCIACNAWICREQARYYEDHPHEPTPTHVIISEWHKGNRGYALEIASERALAGSIPAIVFTDSGPESRKHDSMDNKHGSSTDGVGSVRRPLLSGEGGGNEDCSDEEDFDNEGSEEDNFDEEDFDNKGSEEDHDNEGSEEDSDNEGSEEDHDNEGSEEDSDNEGSEEDSGNGGSEENNFDEDGVEDTRASASSSSHKLEIGPGSGERDLSTGGEGDDWEGGDWEGDDWEGDDWEGDSVQASTLGAGGFPKSGDTSKAPLQCTRIRVKRKHKNGTDKKINSGILGQSMLQIDRLLMWLQDPGCTPGVKPTVVRVSNPQFTPAVGQIAHGPHEAPTSFVDAHLVAGVTIDQAISNVVHNMPFSMSQEELQLRRMVPETVVLCMGKKMAHFEGRIGPDCCIDIDHIFTPAILSDQHLSKIQSRYDPNDPEMKVRDCISMSVYASSKDSVSDDVFGHLLACGALALDALADHSMNMSTPGKMDHIPLFRKPVLPTTTQPMIVFQQQLEVPQKQGTQITGACHVDGNNHLEACKESSAGDGTLTTTVTDEKSQGNGQLGHILAGESAPVSPISSEAVNTGLQATVPTAPNDDTSVFMSDYHMALRTNFCNTFVVATVLPVWGTAKQHVDMMFNPNCEAGPRPKPTHEELPDLEKTLSLMKSELQELRTGIALYVSAEKQHKAVLENAAKQEGTDHATITPGQIRQPPPVCSSLCITLHDFLPSAFRHLHDLQAVVKMQQALQQVYCINAVQASTAVLSEPNSMNFTSCSTMLQLHNLSACFNHLTDLHMRTAAPLPIRRISQQFFAATMRLRLTPEDLLQMKPETHAESIVTFMNAVVSGTEMDQLQAPYFFDCVIHSIMPVEECMAKADLRPVPQAIEYAPGCHDCFYKTYRISTPDGNSKEMHFRINTCMSEDLRQLRVLKTTHSLESQGDCEDFSQGHVSVAKGIMDFKEILDSASKGNAADMRLHDVFNPAEFHTISNGMQVKYIGAFAHLLSQVEHIKCECVT